MRFATSEHIRPIDQTVMDLLRQYQAMTVPDLSGQLDVTATAVRQRLDRLVDVGLIERTKESVGRGRPQFRYSLTPMGLRYSSASYADLATALWAEVMDLSNPLLRSRVLGRVARRMSRELVDQMPAGASVEDRLARVASGLTKRKVPAMVSSGSSGPVLQVLACPFPDLAVDGDHRHVCELEQEMLSEALGQSVQLDCCRLDGHEHCQFRPVAVACDNSDSSQIIERESIDGSHT